MKKFEYSVFIGRFSPFHNGHLEILKKALDISEKVVVVIGSASSPRSVKNPWNYGERKRMIETSLSYGDLTRVSFINMNDYLYNNNLWVSTLQQKVAEATNNSEKIALIGFKSDESSFYLDLFPQFEYVEHGTNCNFHATDIINLYFAKNFEYKSMVPSGTSDFLEKFFSSEFFSPLQEEKKYIDKYKESWSTAPFPPIFVTVDSVVIKSGHILVIKRGHNPGKGLYALAGGFVNQNELVQDAALRELKEETSIKLSLSELRKSIVDSKVFDDPSRSLRGRVISHAFLIDLGTGTLPKIKAGDDAAGAQWMPLNEFYNLESSFFEDHFHIISFFCNKR